MKASRRHVLAGAGTLGVALTAGAGWALTHEAAHAGTLAGADMARGHALRGGGFPAPAAHEDAGVVIAGGGIAGLSAAWTLVDAGFRDFRLLELEDRIGGSARAGRNAVSAYPLGAHYLPVQNREARALRHMLGKLRMITGEDGGAPVYDPYQLCADSQERLYWQGKWHEGLVPRTGLDAATRDQFAAFEAAMTGFSAQVGTDGRPAFAIPLAYSSRDEALLALDRVGFGDWLDLQGFLARALRSHVRYCTRDDYGCEPEDVSAWAGIHYFAARRGWAAGDTGDNVLTWPEGNARIASSMAAFFADKIAGGRIVHRVARDGDGVVVDSFDVAANRTIRTHARAAILAMPHFVASRVAPQAAAPDPRFTYAPWIVANVTVDRLPQGRGVPLAWDNVSATSDSLGYVVATHQAASRAGASVLTWYMPLSRMEPAAARRLMVDRPIAEWQREVADDLLRLHPELDGAIRSIDVWRWAHAMARPVPGFIWGAAQQAHARATPPMFLAHADYSGLSVFEEAHYHGTAAAEGAMRHLGHAHETLL